MKEKIHFDTVEDILGAPDLKEGTEDIKISKITPFKGHPFKVIDDEKMEDLVNSIKENGVLTPVIVRETDRFDEFEMISGHRRMHAAKLAGLDTIPAIVKKYSDDEAIIAMVSSNIQREEILPSERAFSLKMLYDARKRQGKRNDLSCATEWDKSESEPDTTCATEWRKLENEPDTTCTTKCHRLKTAEIIGKEVGMGKTQVKKYIRLTELIEGLLDLVDRKKIILNTAVDISYFDKELQEWVYEYYLTTGNVTPAQISAIKDASGDLSHERFIELMNGAIKKKERKVSFNSKKLNKYFPDDYDSDKCEEIIIGLLEKWREENN